ncbi:MAG: ATP-binding cassette domain-containing protein [Eubacteriales bacterium]|nr:ATP-binding cassette domain-containing protein [Eubacteriales bacterium]
MIKKRLIQLAGRGQKYVALNVLFKVLGLFAHIFIIFQISPFLVSIFEGRAGLADFQNFLIYVIPAILALCLFSYLESKAAIESSKTLKLILRERFFNKLLRLGANHGELYSTAEANHLMLDGVGQLDGYFAAYLPQFFYSLLAPLTLLIALANSDFFTALILFIAVPLIPLTIVAIQTIAKRTLKRYWGRYASLADVFLENLRGLSTLKIYEADEAYQKKMNREAESFRRATMRVLSLQLNSISVMDLVAFGGAALGIGLSISRFTRGQISSTACLNFILLSAQFFIPMRMLGAFFHTAATGMAASDKLFKILDLEEADQAGKASFKFEQSLELDGLSFGYEADRPILKDIHLNLPKSSFIALVGESGCGKSTLASILEGQYQSYTGEIRIDGVELREINEAERNLEILRLSHDSHLFKGSLRENLRLAAPEATDEKLFSVLKRVRLYDFFSENHGLDFEIAESASNLSGGQRQRLALARLLLRDASIYIFDEASSNIDVESEEAILEEIAALAESGKTVLMISHRLKAASKAELIYAMDGGQILEKGSHEELMAQNGLYAKLYHTQSELEARVEGDAPINFEVIDAIRNSERSGRTTRSEECKIPAKMKKTRSGFKIAMTLVQVVKPLTGYMILAILCGILGHYAAAMIPGLGAIGLSDALKSGQVPTLLFIALAVFGLTRGLLHYGEQLANHFIAFKLLALLRDRVFTKLRELAPAKLETRNRGELISLITSDIELLEVFYAHTISPVFIEIFMALGVAIFLACFNPWLGFAALLAQILIAGVLPILSSRLSAPLGHRFRQASAELSTQILDNLHGLSQLKAFSAGRRRLDAMMADSRQLLKTETKLRIRQSLAAVVTNLMIWSLDLAFFALALSLESCGLISASALIICQVLFMSSFGPAIAVSNLGAGLANTFASGERLLNLLEEEPELLDVEGQAPSSAGKIEFNSVDFSYSDEDIFKDFNLEIAGNHCLGIRGDSGCGKSTLLKLLMRFWKIQSGKINIDARSLDEVNTHDLRQMEAYMTQESYLFRGSIAENLRIARADASLEELRAACEKAAILNFIEKLPKGFDTAVSELGSSLSGGERQRMGLARAFLHDAPILLLDEPTSNLDSLNEALVLDRIREASETKTVILVSHRASSLRICDRGIELQSSRQS